jgi:succinate dehydrogenase/fumarate reductase-like Fe-S protein
MNVTLRIDGAEHRVPEGQSLAALLLALQTPSRLSVGGTPRTPFCGMGVCGECRVTVNGEPAVLACLTACRDGLLVTTR